MPSMRHRFREIPPRSSATYGGTCAGGGGKSGVAERTEPGTAMPASRHPHCADRSPHWRVSFPFSDRLSEDAGARVRARGNSVALRIFGHAWPLVYLHIRDSGSLDDAADRRDTCGRQLLGLENESTLCG